MGMMSLPMRRGAFAAAGLAGADDQTLVVVSFEDRQAVALRAS